MLLLLDSTNRAKRDGANQFDWDQDHHSFTFSELLREFVVDGWLGVINWVFPKRNVRRTGSVWSAEPSYDEHPTS